MARRNSAVGSLKQMTRSVAVGARRAEQARQREARKAADWAQKERRALERLNRQQEREEELESARAEHEENEKLERSLRELLGLAPQPIRDRAAHERRLAPIPFDLRARIQADEAQLASLGRQAAEAVPPSSTALIAALRVAAGIVALGFAWLGLKAPVVLNVLSYAVAAAAAILLLLVPVLLERRRKELQRERSAATRRAAEPAVLASREADQRAHEVAEAQRVAGVHALLQGDEAAVAAAVRAALEGLRAPVSAPVSITATGPESLALEIALPSVEETVPAQRSTLLKSGRLSYRNRPKRDVLDLHARVVAALPILHGALALDAAPTLQVVLVSGLRDAVDPASGHEIEECLVSVLLDREALSALKLDRVDPGVVLENFEARFRPTVTAGLKPVEPLTAAALLAAEDAEPAAPEPEPAPRRRSGRAAAASGVEAPPVAAPVDSEAAPQAAAEDALRLAMACARADGQVVPVELAAVDRLVTRFAASPAQAKRLRLLRESLVADRIDVEAAATRLRTGLSADKRRLLLEELAAVAAADAAMPESEVALLERVAAALDVSAAPVAEAQARLREAAEAPQRERLAHLAALELPPDADPDLGVLDRALASIRERYQPARLADLAEEIRALGAARRERAELAHAALVVTLPPERRGSAPVAEAGSGEPRRANQDLDAIFG